MNRKEKKMQKVLDFMKVEIAKIKEAKKEMHCGFQIILTKEVNAVERIVLGKRESKYSPEGFEFVTWRSHQLGLTFPSYVYEGGHYFFDQNLALADFQAR